MNSGIEFARQTTADDFPCVKAKHVWELTGEKKTAILPEHTRAKVVCQACGMQAWRYGQ